MNQKETKQSKSKRKNPKKKWLSSNEVLSGGLAWQPLVDCWLVLEAALVSVSSPLNPPIINNFLNRSKRVRTKDPISNKIVKMAMLHKETSKMAAHRMAALKAVVHKVVAQGQGGPQGGGPGQMPQEGNGGPQGNGPDNGMNQSGGQEGNQGSSKKSNKKNSKNKNKTSDSQSNKENTTNS